MSNKSYVGMSQCIFCGGTKELILDKRLKDSLPRLAVYNLDPCDECKASMEQGFTVFEVTTDQEEVDKFPKHLRIVQENKEMVFTGRFMVISKDSLLAEEFENKDDKMLMDTDSYNDIFGQFLNEDN